MAEPFSGESMFYRKNIGDLIFYTKPNSLGRNNDRPGT